MNILKQSNQSSLLFFIELLMPLMVKITIIYRCVIVLNWIPGLIAYYLLLIVYKWFIFKAYGLVPINGADKIFITDKRDQRYQILSYMQFDTFDAKQFKQIIIDRMLSQYLKFRMKLKQKLLEHWWYEIPIEKAIEKIIILPQMKTEEDVIDHMRQELNIHIDIFNSLPYEFQLIPYGENKGVVLLKFDHLMSDGLGIVSCLCKSSSNYSVDIFPKLMQNITDDRWYIILYNWLVFPVVFIYDIIVLFTFGVRANPLKINKGNAKGSSIFAYSKQYHIRSFDNYKRKSGLSFNDVMTSVLSMAFGKVKQLNSDKYPLWNTANMFLPVGRKPIPSTADDVKLNNDFSVVFCGIPLIQNGSQSRSIQKAIRKNFKNSIQFCHNRTLAVFGELLTWRLMSYFTQLVLTRFDFVFSNVPGPVNQLNYDGFICEKILAFPSSGHAIPFIPLISYNHSFRFAIVVDQNSDFKPEYFINQIEEALNEILNDQ